MSRKMTSAEKLTINPKDLKCDITLTVDVAKSLPIPKTDTEIIKCNDGWLFPEDVQLLNHDDKYLYAFGPTRVWRTDDMEKWELVK